MTNAVPMPQLVGGTRRTSWSSFPFVYEDENLSSLHFEIDSVQSLMDKNAPNQLMLRYTQIMMAFLLFIDCPEHIGMIGLGGGSLPKYCYQHLTPNSHLRRGDQSGGDSSQRLLHGPSG